MVGSSCLSPRVGNWFLAGISSGILDRIDRPQEFHHFYQTCQLFLHRWFDTSLLFLLSFNFPLQILQFGLDYIHKFSFLKYGFSNSKSFGLHAGTEYLSARLHVSSRCLYVITVSQIFVNDELLMNDMYCIS